MKISMIAAGFLPLAAWCLVAPSATKSCLSLLDDANNSSLGHGTRLASSTPIPVGAMIVSGVANQIEFCQVVGSVPYGENETLNFQTMAARYGYI